ncbi:MAG TPA: metallophosphoesterase [Streptosporangiaceae bacterium]|nr:metallophosphoesterase [Streptosporangiaceae bacterium]
MRTPTTGATRARPACRLLLPLLFVLAVLSGCSGSADTPAVPPTSAAPGASGATARAVAPSTAPAASGFLVIGDFGTADREQRSIARAMTEWAAAPGHRTDAIVTTGDNVYPDGAPGLFRDALDEPYSALRRSAPMWATLGNHDVAAGHGSTQLRHLGLPSLPYRKRLAGAELLFVDANRVDSAQARWLEERLAAPGPPLRVVAFHQPAWSCSRHGSTRAVDRLWVPIFERHRVALVLNGHDHNYQRFVSGRGVTYVVTGGGGADLYPVKDGCAETPDRAAAISRHHFTAVQIAGRTMTLTAVAANGAVLDRAVIRR